MQITSISGSINMPIRRIIEVAVILLAVSVIYIAPAAYAYSNVNENEISIETAMHMIERLTSPEFSGRLTGTDGNSKTVRYLSTYFDHIGLISPIGIVDYHQSYTQRSPIINSGSVLQTVDDLGNVVEDYTFVREFSVSVMPGLCIKDDFTGHGTIINTLGELIDKGGKEVDEVALVPENIFREIASNPENLQRVFSPDNRFRAIITEADLGPMNYFPVNVFVLDGKYDPQNGAPILLNCKKEAFKRLVETSAHNQRIHISIDYSVDTVTAFNVIGYIPAADSSDAGQVIIGAHLDHAGDNLNGTYNPGALDNASGIAIMAEVARVVAQNTERPKKNIVFIAFNGEEQGRMGSSYYVKHPVFPLADTTMINLDTIGTTNNVPLSLESYDNSHVLARSTLKTYADKLKIPAQSGLSQGCDHTSFGKAGVDSVNLIHSDPFAGCHGPDDTIENVSPDKVGDIIRLLFYYLDKNAY